MLPVHHAQREVRPRGRLQASPTRRPSIALSELGLYRAVPSFFHQCGFYKQWFVHGVHWQDAYGTVHFHILPLLEDAPMGTLYTTLMPTTLDLICLITPPPFGYWFEGTEQISCTMSVLYTSIPCYSLRSTVPVRYTVRPVLGGQLGSLPHNPNYTE
jgi:hypothetical protein